MQTSVFTVEKRRLSSHLAWATWAALGPGRGHSGAALHPGEKTSSQRPRERYLRGRTPAGAFPALRGSSRIPSLRTGGRGATGGILSGLTSGHQGRPPPQSRPSHLPRPRSRAYQGSAPQKPDGAGAGEI